MTKDPNDPTDGLILDALGVALMAVDHQCRVVRFNTLAEQLTGVRAPTALGKACFDVLQGGLCEVGCPLRESLETGTTYRSRNVILQPKGQPAMSVEMTASALSDEKGEVTGAVAILRDVAAEAGEMRFYGSRIFVSRTPAMRGIFDALPKLASSRAPLVIIGDSGAGRAALAETIHRLGADCAEQPLYFLRCHAKREGSTLAGQLGPDFAQRLSSGTLVLEDVDAASPELQQELLAWLEEGGGQGDVRVISTATARLEERRQEGSFRQDLYFRLSVLQILLPGLAERREDIPLLVEHFIELLNAERGTQVQGLSAAAMQRLMASELPGNVRQLRSLITQAHAACGGSLIDVDDLPPLLQPGAGDAPTPVPWKERQARLEARTIRNTLERLGGNVTRAARELGMHRTTLWRKLKRYEIDTDAE